LSKTVAAVLRRRMKQQDCRRSKGDDGQHTLAGVEVDGSIADRIFELLCVVQDQNPELTKAIEVK
jgi:hypothetical protein